MDVVFVEPFLSIEVGSCVQKNLSHEIERKTFLCIYISNLEKALHCKKTCVLIGKGPKNHCEVWIDA